MSQSDRDHESDVFRDDPDNEIAVNERLALDDEDMSLPWLESDDDGVDDQGAGGGKLAGFLVVALLVLALLVGGFWWLNNRGANHELMADGSTIKAPAQPYKEAPDDPGGKTFAGTGDSSFAVSAGQKRPARLGTDGDVTEDGAKDVAPTDSKPAPVTAPAAATPAPKGVGVQVAAYSTPSAAEAGWITLTQRFEALSGFQHRVIEGKADIGTVYRLQAVTADAASAQALCGRLREAGLSCQVKK